MDYLIDFIKTDGLAEDPFRKYLLLTSLTLGLVQITSWTLRLVSFVYRHAIKWNPNLNKIYN